MNDSRRVIQGMAGELPWRSPLPPHGLDGLDLHGIWSRLGDAVTGEGTGLLAFGADDWRDYELAMRVRAIQGGNVQIVFRAGPEGHYLLDLLLGWQAVAISKADRRPGGRGFHKFSVVNCELARGREFDIQVAARGASLTSYLDGRLINQASDYEFPAGRAGLAVFEGKTEFRDVRYRLLT